MKNPFGGIWRALELPPAARRQNFFLQLSQILGKASRALQRKLASNENFLRTYCSHEMPDYNGFLESLASKYVLCIAFEIYFKIGFQKFKDTAQKPEFDNNNKKLCYSHGVDNAQIRIRYATILVEVDRAKL